MKLFAFQLIGTILFFMVGFTIQGILQLEYGEFVKGWFSCMGFYTGKIVYDSLQKLKKNRR